MMDWKATCLVSSPRWLLIFNRCAWEIRQIFAGIPRAWGRFAGRLTAWLWVWLSCAVASAGPLIVHPKSSPLPTTQQGPFVTTGDGGILCIDPSQAHRSRDEGRTWTSTPLFREPARFSTSNERALLRTKKGTVISAWMNMKERSFTPGFKWGGPKEEYDQWILPTYVSRSLDDGATWDEPQLLQKEWCGCIHSMIQLRSGRIVLVGQTIVPEWRHATIMYVSDDEGATWKSSNILDYGVGRHDHAGSCEATVLERKDGSLYLLLRTEAGFFFESISTDGGLTWVDLKKSKIPSVTCCGQMTRLSDGRAALLWNHPPRRQPTDGASREELSIAFSSDDGATWSKPAVLAARYPQPGDGYEQLRVSYPYLYELKPGQFWITTMQGNVRLQIADDQISQGNVPLPESVVFFGDSTTAFRPGEVKEVTSLRIGRVLKESKIAWAAVNRGVGGNTTADALKRFDRDVATANPKVVVLQFGINDAAVDVWRMPPAKESRVSLEAFGANLKTLVEKVRSLGAQPILMTTNPVRWTPKLRELYGKPPYNPEAEDGFDTPLLAKYNAVTRKMAEELSVPLVDIHAAYTGFAQAGQGTVDSLLLDGMHPNDAGHDLNAKTLQPVLTNWLPKE